MISDIDNEQAVWIGLSDGEVGGDADLAFEWTDGSPVSYKFNFYNTIKIFKKKQQKKKREKENIRKKNKKKKQQKQICNFFADHS